jgi:hypothetical protein
LKRAFKKNGRSQILRYVSSPKPPRGIGHKKKKVSEGGMRMFKVVSVVTALLVAFALVATVQPGAPEPPKFKSENERRIWVLSTLLP